MPVAERDPHTGHATTGHEWNGITELNTPVPRLIYIALAITVVFSVVWWLLFPAWPLGTTFTRGLLGTDQHARVAEDLRQAAEARAAWTGRIAEAEPAAVASDAGLMEIVRQAGPALFEDNCAVCHGGDGQGGPGFPSLIDDAWLWGGEPATIVETLRVGINDTHPETRVSRMLAFGRDGILSREQVDQVGAFVRSLSDPAVAEEAPDAVETGATVFAENCASCHGENGTGMTALGAPDLTDDSWIYGGDAQAIRESIWRGRQGQMPAWEGRLSPVELKILAAYVLDFGGRQ